MFWYIPIILAFHNAEEALTMPQWISVHLPMVQEKILFFVRLQFSSTQLYISLVLVTVLPFLLTFICQRGKLTQRKLGVMLILQSIIFWNALVPHIAGIFVLRMYNPGVVTALVCNVPFSFYLLKRVQQEGILPNVVLRNCIIIGLAVYLPLVYLNHLIAQALVSIF